MNKIIYLVFKNYFLHFVLSSLISIRLILTPYPDQGKAFYALSIKNLFIEFFKHHPSNQYVLTLGYVMWDTYVIKYVD